MVKKITLLVCVFVSFFTVANAQLENPVKWNCSAKKIDQKTYELHMSAIIDGNWHIYAQNAGEGPEPTSFKFYANPLVKLDGKVKESGKLEKSFDPNFNSTLRYYSNQVDFIQKVKIRSSATTLVKGSVTFMVCNDKKCLPPKEIPFSIKVAGK